MTVIVCLDDRNGMRFHGRRQSRDRAVAARMLADCQGGLLYVCNGSVPLFPPTARMVIQENLPQAVPDDGTCFVEQPPLMPIAHRITQLIVYRWNRRYPADAYLDLPLEQWKRLEQAEFCGHSHPIITREVYVP